MENSGTTSKPTNAPKCTVVLYHTHRILNTHGFLSFIFFFRTVTQYIQTNRYKSETNANIFIRILNFDVYLKPCIIFKI